MKAIIVNFRGSYKTQKASNHVLVAVNSIKTREAAEKLVSKKIVWTNTKGRQITGKIASAHGNKGVLRAVFEKGLPGQALGKEAEIV